jgi:hypothetical protein
VSFCHLTPEQAGATISFRVAGCNVAGHGLFSPPQTLELRTPLDADYDEAARLVRERQVVVGVEPGEDSEFVSGQHWGSASVRHHESLDEEEGNPRTRVGRLMHTIKSAEVELLDPFFRGLMCVVAVLFLVLYFSYSAWLASLPPMPMPTSNATNATNATNASATHAPSSPPTAYPAPTAPPAPSALAFDDALSHSYSYYSGSSSLSFSYSHAPNGDLFALVADAANYSYDIFE